jgi:hypothetical protein
VDSQLYYHGYELIIGETVLKIKKEARKPPYHFINQNLNRLWNESTSMYVESLITLL